MPPKGADQQIRTVAREERVGKVFIALADGMRQCLICDGIFSRQDSFEHSKDVCYPSSSNPH
jgi:hypothetical protein